MLKYPVVHLVGRANNTADVKHKLFLCKTRKAPSFLGEFDYRQFKGRTLEQAIEPMPEALKAEVRHLATFQKSQQFNTVFIQKYEPGMNVKSHRDPRNNIGHTVIGLYGNFGHTNFYVEDLPAIVSYHQRPGDVLVVPCTINGVQGPRHWMTWPELIEPGVSPRTAIILNTIQ